MSSGKVFPLPNIACKLKERFESTNVRSDGSHHFFSSGVRVLPRMIESRCLSQAVIAASHVEKPNLRNAEVTLLVALPIACKGEH